MKNTVKAILLTNLLWLMGVSSCANGTIKTWIINEKGLEHNQGNVHEAMDFLKAVGYRCYSKIDDEYWRTRLAACESAHKTAATE